MRTWKKGTQSIGLGADIYIQNVQTIIKDVLWIFFIKEHFDVFMRGAQKHFFDK